MGELLDVPRAFSRTAPPDLTPPGWLLAEVDSSTRSDYIAHHGFTPAQIRPEWWLKRDIIIRFASEVNGEPVLSRGDLFQLANEVADEDSLLTFLWHVLAWGSGTSRRNNDRRLKSCRGHLSMLREAFDYAQGSDPAAAYSTLIKPGGAKIPYFGPAFFSKFLYFASENATRRCLILDARVARSLWTIGWSMAPTYPGRTFSYNWYTDTYVSYCALLESWAAAHSSARDADMFERALFRGPPPA